jgi:N-acetylglucosamine-6-phosphate deacetylase
MQVIVEDGVAKLPDRSAFAGSVATADRLIRTMMELADVSLVDAVRMMTKTPARIMKVDDQIGSLEKGMDADLIVFDKQINIQQVIIKGKKLSF